MMKPQTIAHQMRQLLRERTGVTWNVTVRGPYNFDIQLLCSSGTCKAQTPCMPIDCPDRVAPMLLVCADDLVSRWERRP